MRIDAHQHFWRYRPEQFPWMSDDMDAIRRDFLPADLEPLLTSVGLDACISVQAQHSLRETEWLLELAEVHPFIAGVVGWVDLRAPAVRQDLERLAAHRKLVGIRHIVQDEPDPRFLLGPDFCRGVAALAEFDLAYDILIFPRHLPAAAEFAARFPSNRFVLDHLAKPEIRLGLVEPWARGLRTLAQCPHVYAKISGLATEADWNGWTSDDLRRYVRIAYECFGPDRLMIGSDWPVSTLAGDYVRIMTPALEWIAGLPAAEQNGILGGNAARVYRCQSGGSRESGTDRLPVVST